MMDGDRCCTQTRSPLFGLFIGCAKKCKFPANGKSRSSSENLSQRRASLKTESGSFINDRPFPKRGKEYRSHHVAPTRNLIRRGYHDVLADRKVAQRPAYLDSGPAFVRHITHHNKQVYVAPLVGITLRPGAEEHDARRLEPSDDAIHHDRNVRFRGHRVLSYRLQPRA